MQYIAQKGEIPKIGETWVPVGRKTHLIQLCLFRADQVKQLVTKELSIVRKADFGICRVKHEILKTSPIYGVCHSRIPILAIGGLNMKGFQAEEAEVLGFIPEKSNIYDSTTH